MQNYVNSMNFPPRICTCSSQERLCRSFASTSPQGVPTIMGFGPTDFCTAWCLSVALRN